MTETQKPWATVAEVLRAHRKGHETTADCLNAIEKALGWSTADMEIGIPVPPWLAALWAAAPEMLDRLKELLRYHDSGKHAGLSSFLAPGGAETAFTGKIRDIVESTEVC